MLRILLVLLEFFLIVRLAFYLTSGVPDIIQGIFVIPIIVFFALVTLFSLGRIFDGQV